jgi:hypothetical protein
LQELRGLFNYRKVCGKGCIIYLVEAHYFQGRRYLPGGDGARLHAEVFSKRHPYCRGNLGYNLLFRVVQRLPDIVYL